MGAEVTSDIGQAEAWIANLKGMHEDRRSHQARIDTLAESRIASALALQTRTDNDAQNHSINMNAIAIAEAHETVRIGKLAGDRIWNLDEQTWLAAAGMTGIAKIIRQIVREEMTSE